jgi:hypothetical protein
LSSHWVYGRSGAASLGGTTCFVRFTAYNGGYTQYIRYLRIGATYSLPAAGAPTVVTYSWNDGSDRTWSRAVPAGTSAASWTVPTASAVLQRKVVVRVPSGAPVAGDSDGDGIADAAEAAAGFNPADPDEDGNGIPDGLDDWDADGVLNQSDASPGTAPAGGGGGGGGSGGGGCGALGLEALAALLLSRRRR